MNQMLTPERLAGFFDHTLLKPYATKKDFENFCNSCKQYRFAMAAVNPSAVQFCKHYLNDTRFMSVQQLVFLLVKTL